MGCTEVESQKLFTRWFPFKFQFFPFLHFLISDHLPPYHFGNMTCWIADGLGIRVRLPSLFLRSLPTASISTLNRHQRWAGIIILVLKSGCETDFFSHGTPFLALMASGVRSIHRGRSSNTTLELLTLLLPAASSRDDLRPAERDFPCLSCRREQKAEVIFIMCSKIWWMQPAAPLTYSRQSNTKSSTMAPAAQLLSLVSALRPRWSSERMTEIYTKLNKNEWSNAMQHFGWTVGWETISH